MRSNDRAPVVPWVLIGCLLVINGITIFILVRQRAESLRWHAQYLSLRAQLDAGALDTRRARPAPEIATAPDAFAKVPEGSIPGRYRWLQSEQEKGIITLEPDHTFRNEKGERFAAYRWELSRDELVLFWQSGSTHYTQVESPGVYVGRRTDGKTQRMEKVE